MRSAASRPLLATPTCWPRVATAWAIERFRILAQTVGLDGDGEAFLRWLAELKQRIGIPRGPAEAGVKPTEVGRLTELAFADTCHLNNPRPCTPEDFRRLWGEAFAPARSA